MVLLGSIASPKYVGVLGVIFGERLRFPVDFVGRGDMSRGGLLLRKASEGVELEYVPVAGAVSTARGRRGSRASREADGHGDPARRRTTSSLSVDGKDVRLTNLRKLFWPELGLTKGDLLRTTRRSPASCCRTSAIARWS